jgi:DegV family protein with EDD domain
MNQKIAVVTDSTAYIPPEALGDLNIPVIPLWVLWDDERFRDGVDIDPSAFYRRLQTGTSFPTTSQPSAGEFVDFFRRVADEAQTDTIVGIYVTSKLSGTMASAEAAQTQLPELNITNIDSLLTSMAQGFIALAAARVAADGGSLEEVVAAAQKVQEEMSLLFTVDTLEYLHRGGRIGGAKRLLGTALSIKPLLHIEEGVVKPLVQVRTKRKALARMLDITEERLGDRRMAGNAVAEQVKERFDISPVYRTVLSPVIGTHGGPGTVGIAFYPER